MLINRLFKGAGGDFITWAMKSNKFPKDAIDKISGYVTKYGDVTTPDVSDINKITLDTFKEIETKGYKLSREENFNEAAGELYRASEKPAEAINGLIEGKIKKTSSVASESQSAFISNFELKLEKVSPNLFKFYKTALSNPKALKEQFGITNRDIFIAFSNPQYAKNDTLKQIAEVWRAEDKTLLDTMMQNVPIGQIDSHVVPYSPNPLVVESLGEDIFAEAIEKYTTLTEKASQDVAQNYFKRLRAGAGGNKKIKFDSRKLTFREGEEGLHDQYEFYKLISGLDEDTNGIFERALSHKKQLIQDYYFYKEFGGDGEDLIKKVKNKLIEFGEDEEQVKLLDKGLNKNLQRFRASAGFDEVEESNLLHIVEGISKLMSGTFGASFSSIRNFTIDFPAHGGSIRNSIMTNEGYPAIFWNRIGVPLSLMAQNVVDKVTGKTTAKQHVSEILDLFGFSHTNNALFSAQGLKGEQFFEDLIKYKKGASSVEKISRIFNQKMGAFNQFMNSAAGNIMHFDSTSAVNLLNASAYFSQMVLKHANYQSFMKAMPFDRHYLKGMFGIDEGVFGALKESFDTIGVVIKPAKVNKVLGHNDLKVLVPKTVSKMDDSIALKYKNIEETVEMFKERTRIAYQSLLTHQRNMVQSNLYKANRETRLGITRGSFIDILTRFFGQFADITHSQQYDGIRQAVSIGLYGNPFHGSYSSTVFNRKSAGYWAKVFAFYTAGATVNTWVRDVLHGRSPRTLNERQMAMIIAGSGVGGIPFMMVTPFLYSGHKSSTGYYGTTPFGHVTNQFVEAYKAFRKDGLQGRTMNKSAKFLQTVSGVGRLWYTKGMFDQIINHSTLTAGERASIEEWWDKELGSPYIWNR